jgi:hypothetical protein
VIIFPSQGLLTCFGTLQALMLPVSEQLVELCGPNYLDIPIMRTMSTRFNTPWIAILFNATITLAFSFVDFNSLVDALNLLHATVLILVMISFIALRFTRDGQAMLRPFSAVSHRYLAPLLMLPPLLICMWLIVGIIWLRTFWAGVGTLILYAFGVIVYYLCQCRKRRKHVVKYVPVASETDGLIQKK